jgi:lysophospholipase L1-like esterase
MAMSAFQQSVLRRAFIFTTMIAVSVFFAVTLAEGLLRLVPGVLPVELQQVIRADPRDYGVDHPYIGYLHKPNNALVISGRDFHAVHHTDGYGFRNAWPWPKTADIITLGDSVTFGQGVEDEQAWPAILARSFPRSPVINLGLIGAGPQQYLRVYETFGVKLHPKVVLVGFFTGNDFWDAGMFELWSKSGAGNYMVWRDFGKPLSVSLDLQQPIRNLVSSLLWRAKLLARKSQFVNLLLYARDNFNRWIPARKTTFVAPDGRRLELAPQTLANNAKYARPGYLVFRAVLESLQEIHSRARADGATALIVLQPSKEEVYLPLVGEPPPDPGAPLRAALADRKIPYLDLLPEFRRRAAKGEVLFFETDGHPNARGYALIAEIVASYLAAHAGDYGL